MSVLKTMKSLAQRFDSLATTSHRHDSIVNQASGLGTYEDSAMHARPSLMGRLSDEELDVLYLQSDLARRLVEELVDDVIRQGWEVTDFNSGSVVDEPNHLDIKEQLKKAWYNARVQGGGAVAMISKDADLSAPLVPGKEILSLVALDPRECQVFKWENNATNSRFTEPKTYVVSPRNATGEGIGFAPEFHYSRILAIKGPPLPSSLDRSKDGWGDSLLQSCWGPVRNFEQAELAISNIVQRFEIATYSINGLANILDSDEQRQKILSRMKVIQQTISMVRAVVLDGDAGETYSRQFSTVNGLDTLWDRLAHSVAKAGRYPMTKLFGMSPSGLATDDESGRANWRAQIEANQEKIRPLLEQYYTHINGGSPVLIKFKPQDEATAEEEANVAKTKAETRKIYVEMNSARPEEFRQGMLEEGLIHELEMDADLEGDVEEGLEDAERESALSGLPSDEVPAPVGADDEGDGEADNAS